MNKYIAGFSSEDPIHELLILTSRPTIVTQITIENVCTLTHIENILLLKNCVQDGVFDAVMLHSEVQYSYTPVHKHKSCTDFLQSLFVLQNTKIKHLHVEESKTKFQLEFKGRDKISIHCPHFTHLLSSNTFLQNSNIMAISRATRERRLPYLTDWQKIYRFRALPVLSRWQSLRLLDLKTIIELKIENLVAALHDTCPRLGSVFIFCGHKDRTMKIPGSDEWENLGNITILWPNIGLTFQIYIRAIIAKSKALHAWREAHKKQQIEMLEPMHWRIHNSDLTPKCQSTMSKMCYLNEETKYLLASENIMDLSSIKHAHGSKPIEKLPYVNYDNESFQNTLKETEKEMY